jgi:hypothetical protein
VQHPAIEPRPAEPAPAPGSPRVLILTTDIGEGHDLPARELAAAIEADCPAAEVVVADGLAAMGKLLEAVVKDQSRLIFDAPPWMFDLEYRVFSRWRPTRVSASALNYALGARGLMRLIRAHRPDIVASTYPGTTAVLGILRRRGRLDVPACAVVTDLAALRFWAHPGVDLTLVTHTESIDEVRSIAPDTDVRWVRGLTGPGFTDPATRQRAAACSTYPTKPASWSCPAAVGRSATSRAPPRSRVSTRTSTSSCCAGETTRCGRTWPPASATTRACAWSASPTT